jgi:autotransporter-associated beta strand protein
MNHWIGSWVDGGGGSQFWTYDTDSSAWVGPTALSAFSFSAGTTSEINYSVPLAAMNLMPGDVIYFDAYSSGGGVGDSAVDSLANPNVSVTGWGGPYTSYAMGAGGPGLNTYTLGFPHVTTINVGSGTTQTQAAAGYALFSGASPIEKIGAGTLVLDQANTLASNVNVRGGTVRLGTATALLSGTLSPFAGGTVSLGPQVRADVTGLAANAGGLVDVGTGAITVSAAGLSTSSLTTALAEGFAAGAWTGTSGIVSSAAAASVAGSVPRTVGWIENPNGSLTFGFAAPGDTNLDWMIDMLDVAAIIGSDKFGTGAAATWQEGDFNYDGMLDFLDAAALISADLYDTGLYNTPPAQAVAAVPEPSFNLDAVLSALALGGMLMWRRPTQKRRSARCNRRYSSGRRVAFLGIAAALIAFTTGLAGTEARGQGTLSPLTTFGSNGWLAPGMIPYLSTTNLERGLGWNPVTGNLVVPSRGSGTSVAILDGTTGAVIRTLNTSGVSGGALAMTGAGVSDDGEIYVCNMQTGSSALSPFKIYKWSSEQDADPPTTAFSAINPSTTTGAWRFGDSFAVYGSGASLTFAAAGLSSGTSGGLPNNSNFMIGKLDGSNGNTIYRGIPSGAGTTNDYRLGLTFVDADTVIGTQGGTAKATDFSPVFGTSGTTRVITGSHAIVTGSIALGAADRQIAYTELNGRKLLATVSSTTAVVSVHDITNPWSAKLLASGLNVTGSLALNSLGSGGIQWGPMLGSTSRVLYAMSTNRGIQAMVFTSTGITITLVGGTQTQADAGYASLSGTLSLLKTGTGTLVLDQANTLTGSTTVQAGVIQLSHPAALATSAVTPMAGGTLTVAPFLKTTLGGLAPSAGGLTDVGSGIVTVAAGLSTTDLLAALSAGRNDGSWNGTGGITSSAAASLVSQFIPRSVGWLDHGGGSVTFGFAAPGDTNLDWMIDMLDVAAIIGSDKFGTGAAATWQEGDFNYDGYVDMVDAAAFLSTNLYDAGSYNAGSLALAGGNGLGTVAAVPEPASLSILLAACGGACLLTTRRSCSNGPLLRRHAHVPD